MSDTIKLPSVTISLLDICNDIFPTLDCGYYSEIEESQLKRVVEVLAMLNQENLDIAYPDRFSHMNKH